MNPEIAPIMGMSIIETIPNPAPNPTGALTTAIRDVVKAVKIKPVIKLSMADITANTFAKERGSIRFISLSPAIRFTYF